MTPFHKVVGQPVKVNLDHVWRISLRGRRIIGWIGGSEWPLAEYPTTQEAEDAFRHDW